MPHYDILNTSSNKTHSLGESREKGSMNENSESNFSVKPFQTETANKEKGLRGFKSHPPHHYFRHNLSVFSQTGLILAL